MRSASYQNIAVGYFGGSALMFGGNFPLFSLAYMISAVTNWRTLLARCASVAVRRALLSTGRRIAISTAMMPITTSNSTRVNAFWRVATAWFICGTPEAADVRLHII